MATYLITYSDYLKSVTVGRFATPAAAEAYAVDRLPPDLSARIVSSETDLDNAKAYPTRFLVDLYNVLARQHYQDAKQITKFENRETAQRRVFQTISGLGLDHDHTQDKEPTMTLDATHQDHVEAEHPDHGATTAVDEKAAAKAAKAEARAAAKAAKPVKTPKAAAGHAAKPAAEFKAVRAGSDRAKLLPLMDGTRTPDEVGAAHGGAKMTGGYVLQHAYCLHRDCGIGYSLHDGKLKALYPHGKSLADAIVEKAAKAA